jgi:hypothetical protein
MKGMNKRLVFRTVNRIFPENFTIIHVARFK